MPSDLISGLLSYLNHSPTPYHAVAYSQRLLRDAGFRVLHESDRWELSPGDRVMVTRGDATIGAFIVGDKPPSEAGFLLAGAHTDSPNLRLKPNAELSRHGYNQLGVEMYGGALLTTWLDRDLSLAGRVYVAQDGGMRSALVDLHAPLLRIPNLAIHLNRTVNTDGLKLNIQQHMVPVLGLTGEGKPLTDRLVTALGEQGLVVSAEQILGGDLCLYDVQPACLGGESDAFIFSGRLDNLAGSHAALHALSHSRGGAEATRGIVLYDHEEVGSRSAQGANSTFLEDCLARLCLGVGNVDADAMPRALARSFMVSCDTAHAVHPNYAEMHDGNHRPLLGAGPVIKRNAGQSYATDAESEARFVQLCRAAGVMPQHFVTRSDLGCGSTIGPISASRLGIRTVDVGSPLLAMHSIREMGATADAHSMTAVMHALFA